MCEAGIHGQRPARVVPLPLLPQQFAGPGQGKGDGPGGFDDVLRPLATHTAIQRIRAFTAWHNQAASLRWRRRQLYKRRHTSADFLADTPQCLGLLPKCSRNLPQRLSHPPLVTTFRGLRFTVGGLRPG